jgi:hypothetical protein
MADALVWREGSDGSGDDRWRLIGTEKHSPHIPMKARANSGRIVNMEGIR